MTAAGTHTAPTVLLIGADAGATASKLLLTRPAAGWQLLSCRSVPEALQSVPEAPDLVVLAPDIVMGDQPDAVFEHAKRTWPQTSFLLVSSLPLTAVTTLLERHGNMAVCSPDLPSLGTAIERELTGLSHGSLRGLSLPGLLQMMEWDRKSLSVRVQSAHDWGRLHLHQGQLVNAYAHARSRTGEAAALEILGWDDVSLTLERSYHNQRQAIGTPLAALLMQAMQRKDESGAGAQPNETRPDEFSIEDLIFEDAREDDMLFRKTRKERGPGQAAPTTQAPDPTRPSSGEAPAFPTPEETHMANVKASLDTALTTIDGAFAAALVDYSSGMALGMVGSGINLEMAAAGNTEVVRAKLRTMSTLGIQGSIEDILITLDQQYHVLYLIPNQTLFLYLALNKAQANLAMARYKLKALGAEITI